MLFENYWFFRTFPKNQVKPFFWERHSCIGKSIQKFGLFLRLRPLSSICGSYSSSDSIGVKICAPAVGDHGLTHSMPSTLVVAKEYG
jgi:hypothetical protein